MCYQIIIIIFLLFNHCLIEDFSNFKFQCDLKYSIITFYPLKRKFVPKFKRVQLKNYKRVADSVASFFLRFLSGFFHPMVLLPHFDCGNHLVPEPMLSNFQNLKRFIHIRSIFANLNILQVNYPSWIWSTLGIGTWKAS